MSEMCVKNLLSITCIIVFRQKGQVVMRVSMKFQRCKKFGDGVGRKGEIFVRYLDFGGYYEDIISFRGYRVPS